MRYGFVVGYCRLVQAWTEWAYGGPSLEGRVARLE